MTNEQTNRRKAERREQPESLEAMLTAYRAGDRGMPSYAELQALVCQPSVDRNAVKGLIEAGALRQYRHNDGSTTGVVFGYDKAITDRFISSLAAPVAQPLAPSGAVPDGLRSATMAAWSVLFDHGIIPGTDGMSLAEGIRAALASQPLAGQVAAPAVAQPDAQTPYAAVLENLLRKQAVSRMAEEPLEAWAFRALVAAMVAQPERSDAPAGVATREYALEWALRDMVFWFGKYPEFVPDEAHFERYRAVVETAKAILAAPSQQPTDSARPTKQCEYCGGDGEHSQERGCYTKCEACDGTGSVPATDSAAPSGEVVK